MNRQDFRFFHRLRVRWAEIDMQKIVFNAHYLMYADTAMTEYWRAVAMPYQEAMQLLDGDLFVKKATVLFDASARIDDRLDIGLKCTRIGTSSLAFTAAIFRGDQLLVTCEIVYVFADPATQKSKPVPQLLRELIMGFEDGADMLRVAVGDWVALGADARKIRTAVFIEEQEIAADLEWDEADATSIHSIAYNLLGQPVATARLLQPSPGIARIGRVAVHRVLRGTQVGRRLMTTLMKVAAERGDREAVLSAQVSAERFYRDLGFVRTGEVFEEAGIAHVDMSRPIAAN